MQPYAIRLYQQAAMVGRHWLMNVGTGANLGTDLENAANPANPANSKRINRGIRQPWRWGNFSA